MSTFTHTADCLNMYEMCMKAGMTKEADFYREKFLASLRAQPTA